MNSRCDTPRPALRLALYALAAAVSWSDWSQAAPDEFYAGRTITIITSGGGAYEAYGRAFARHMPKYIPGRPTMIVQAMPAPRASSIRLRRATAR